MGIHRTILVVEDDGDLSDILAEALEGEGYVVRCVADGLAALAAVASVRPALVLSDVNLPGLDGVTLATQLRGIGVPVVLVSAGPVPGVRAVPFVAKPFDLDHLLTVVASELDNPPSPSVRGR